MPHSPSPRPLPAGKPHRARRRPVFETLERRELLAVVINEIHYDPIEADARLEFVELHNTAATAVDLSNWRLDNAVDFTFPPGATIGPQGYAVIAQNAADFAARFGFAPLGEWEAGDRLSNAGETLELYDADDAEVDRVAYKLGFPWPTVGDNGSSIELVHPELDNDTGGAWRSATGVAGAPLVAAGATWRYRKGQVSNPPGNWNAVGFDEATDAVAWQSGAASLGYGDGDDATVLSDMRFNYPSIYVRKAFQLDGVVPASLTLRLYVDDGAIIYLNGQEVARRYVSGGVKNYNSTSGASHDAVWEELTLTGLGDILQAGENVIAAHVLNATTSSSDLSFDLELTRPVTLVSPGAPNSALVENPAPLLSQVRHSLDQPASGREVVITARVRDADGVAGVTLAYQIVEPGDYIALDDPRYATQWATLPMVDDGTNGDAVAGDGFYAVVVPGDLQTHRRLIRYRVTASDALGAAVTAPYADDPQPNFAYYVYDQTPDWTGAVRPGVTAATTYSGELLDSVSAYHLITTRDDHEEAQHIPDSSNFSGYGGSEYRWDGALVFNGHVYDHIRYRARGGVWRYSMGKNMWKFDFNRGHEFQALDAYGNPYPVGWDKLNLSAIIQQGDFWHRGEQGLFESVGFKLFNMAGVESPETHYVHFRIVESADELGADQYSGDFQGLYLAVEQLDGEFLAGHDLPDGNLYKMEGGIGVGGIGGELNNQGDYPAPTDSSDLIAFKTTYESGPQSADWWRQNLDLENYYSYRSIVEAIHHYDIGDGKNYFYYHNPETGLWSTIPWDLDLTWANNMYGNGNEPFRSRVLAIPEFAREYRNRMREIVDLLYNPDQAGTVVDEMASFVYTPGEPSLVDADRAMWDYNPILTSRYVNSSKAGVGRFYAGGPGIPARGSFAGMIDLVKDYIASRGAWIGTNVLTDDAATPYTPTIAYAGVEGFSVDDLRFTTSEYSHPTRDEFAAIEWRIGEISRPGVPGFDPDEPWRYEIDAVWESGALTTFDTTVAVPGAALEPGRTYRARVRMQDATGRWSHWSAPVEFIAAAGAAPSLAITELHYHPLNPDLVDEDDQEFVEIFNTGDAAIDLSGYQLADFATTPYVIPSGTIVRPGEYLVIARNPAVFTDVYGTDVALAPTGYSTANLSNGGEAISLRTPSGTVVVSVTYDDVAPWPTEPDGLGPSLEIIDPWGDPNDPANWRASAASGGSPGSSGVVTLPGDYDRDGSVAASDLAVWEAAFGDVATPAGTGADGNANGRVDGGDFLIWQRSFGQTSAASVGVAAAAAADGTWSGAASTSGMLASLSAEEATTWGDAALAVVQNARERHAERPALSLADASSEPARRRPDVRSLWQVEHEPAAAPAATAARRITRASAVDGDAAHAWDEGLQRALRAAWDEL